MASDITSNKNVFMITNVQSKIQLSTVKDTSRIKCMSEREVKESCDKTSSRQQFYNVLYIDKLGKHGTPIT